MDRLPLTLTPPITIQPASTLLIRADATRQIGNGHVMRCLALAAEWQYRGGHTVFLTHSDNPAIMARIDQSGAERIPLSVMHPRANDLPELLAVLSRRHPAWAVLDGYHFTPCYQEAVQEAMRTSGGKTLVVDDMAHHSHYHADLLLNQNVYADSLLYSCSPSTVLQLGTRYALLRPEFVRWQNWQRPYPQTARKVLVTLGGTDPDNVTLKAVQALGGWRGREYTARIVIGPGNPHQAVLQQAIAETGSDIELLSCPHNMGELMAWADVAVAGAGTTALELAYMQVPVLSIVLADNQRRVAATLTAAGAMQTLGWHDAITPYSLAQALSQLTHNPLLRRSMGIASKQMVDGRGAQRIVDVMTDTPGTRSENMPVERSARFRHINNRFAI